MERSDTDSKYGSGAPEPPTKKKLRTEIVHKKCVTTDSRQDFKPSEFQSTDNESRRGLPLQIIGDIVIEYDNNQMEVDDGNLTIDHVQKPKQIIGVRMNKAPKTSVARGREFRARKALLKQQCKQQQEPDATVEMATEDIRSAGPSEKNQVPEPSEIRTIEKRAKSAEATRRWREKKKGVSGLSKKQAKTAAQRMREYRERKKFNNPSGNNEEQSNLCDLTLKYDDITKYKKAHENFDRKSDRYDGENKCLGSEELGENYHTLPLSLAGDFNINFASEDGQLLNQDSTSGNEIKVFCPKCNTEVSHTAEGIQEDKTKILVAKVYHYFEQEYEELKKMYGGLDLTPLSKFRQRTALATGVSETTLLQILQEEEERNADKRREPPQKRRAARKRRRQTESSSEEDSSDGNDEDMEQPSYADEVQTLVVKMEPPEFNNDEPEIFLPTEVKLEPSDGDSKAQLQTDPISVDVKTEPRDDELDTTNETPALHEPAATKRRGKKISRKNDDTSTRQHTPGESSAPAASRSVPLTETLHESWPSGEREIKIEEVEIQEEGFS